nr:TIGR01906 family membrane protein [Limosilactobacillus fastidiosus]
MLVLEYFLAATSIAIIVATNVSIFLLYPFERGIDWENVIINYHRLLIYLQVPGIYHLAFQHLPISNSAIAHFRMIRHLLIANEVLCVTSWGTIIINDRYEKKRNQLYLLISLIDYLCFTLLVMVGLVVIDFNRAFIAFHRLMFRDSNWIFNPSTDPIINAMPPNFFLKLFCIWFAISILILIGFRVTNKRRLLRGEFCF